MSWASRHNLLAGAVNRNLGGVSVLWGAVSGAGIFEHNSQLIINDNVISLEYVLHNLPTADFGTIKYGDNLTVDGSNYTVREPMVIGDGRYMMVSLTKIDVILSIILREDGDKMLREDDYSFLREI